MKFVYKFTKSAIDKNITNMNNYFLANAIILEFPILKQFVKFNSRSFVTQIPSAKYFTPESLILSNRKLMQINFKNEVKNKHS